MGLPTVISIVLFLMYYIISITGEKYGKEGAADPTLGMWVATIVFIPLGVYLTIQASKDRVVFNIDKYIVAVQNAINRFMAFRRYRKMKRS